MSTVLVTGGVGFIGSHVSRAYLARGHRVVIVDDGSSGRKDLVPAEAELHQMDVRDPALPELFQQVRPDVVNHHAAQISVQRSVQEPQMDASVNVVGSVNVLEAAAKSRAKRFIFSSTGGALYGEPHYHPCDEEHPIAPLSPYGLAKYCVEHYVRYYSLATGMPSVVLRYGNVYGPGQDPHGEAGVVAIFTRRLLDEQQAVINGSGEQERDFVYVGDVVAANVLALERGDNGTYNIGTGRGHSVNELYRLLEEATSAQRPPIHGEAKPGEVFRITLECSRAERELGWQATTSFAEGLKLTVEAFAAGMKR